MKTRDRDRLVKEEAILAPSMLMEKYNNTEHPAFTKAKWLKATEKHNTMPYWAWVSSQIDEVLDAIYKPRTNAKGKSDETPVQAQADSMVSR